jgi:DNA-binding response OmpR family regulator
MRRDALDLMILDVMLPGSNGFEGLPHRPPRAPCRS